MRRSPFIRILFALGAAALAFTITQSFRSIFAPGPFTLFFAAVMVSAWFGGLTCGLVATITSAIAVEHFIITPFQISEIRDIGTLVRLTVFIGTGSATSWLFASLHQARLAAEATEARVEAEHDRLVAVVQQMPVGVILSEQPAGEVLLANEQGRSLAESPAVRNALEGGPSLRGDEIVYRRPEGDYAVAQASSARVLDRNGNTVARVVTSVDVTERKRSEDTIRRLNRDLERRVDERTSHLRETIAELEAFSHTIAHDLRAPLRAMEAFAAMLREEYAGRLDATGDDYLLRISRAARHMDALIIDLLEYGHLSRESFDPIPLDVADLVREQIAARRGWLVKHGVEISLEIPTTLPRAFAHHSAVGQALGCLIDNAVKFTPADRPYRVTVRAEAREGHVRLWVNDEGIGIDPRHQDRIFGVFERLHGDAYPGTGMGLAIVRKIALRLGGAAGVESEPGRGSRFWIDLPRVPTPATVPSDAASRLAPTPEREPAHAVR